MLVMDFVLHDHRTPKKEMRGNYKENMGIHGTRQHIQCLYILACTFHGLGHVSCSESELTSKITNRFTHSLRTLWTVDRSNARPLCLHRTAQHRKTPTYIHASSGIRTHDPSLWAVQDHMRLIPCTKWDRHGRSVNTNCANMFQVYNYSA
jgi:hypothetical protein